jgi:paraquat-inducible protein A
MNAFCQAAAIGKTACPTCGLLGSPVVEPACQRCGTLLHLRKPNSIQRSWALLIAAYVLYLPANLLPIMETRSVFGMQQDTIMSGVVYLWSSGSWVLALVVFVASVAVPLLKMLSLTVLLVGVQRRSSQQPLQRTKLYRFLELIGRWSMLDVYVVTILVALVQVQSLALIRPGAGVIAFAAVVVLSMLATHAFEPRLIWDAVDHPNLSSAGPTQVALRTGDTTTNKEITS